MERPAQSYDVTADARRWLLVPAAILVQLALGSVYAWSVFNKPLQAQFGWDKAHAVLPFEVAIGSIFVGSMIGGRIQDRFGPRPVALAGGLLYALGVIGASLVHRADQLWLLVLSYGFVGGAGLGAIYITPIAMLAKWFPDKRGLITGLAVGGFGFGAVLTAPVGKMLLAKTTNVPSVFLPLGIAYAIMCVLGAMWFRNPTNSSAKSSSTTGYTLREALRTPQWFQLCGALLLNTLCGIALVSQASDAAQDLAGATAAAAAGIVGFLAVFNGAGRIVWAAASDRLGRTRSMALMLALQAGAFLALPHVPSAAFVPLAALIYLCYGGGFGVIPATASDFFGTRYAGAIYGSMIVAWSAAGALGPLIASKLYESSGKHYGTPFTVIGVIAAISVILPLVTRPPAKRA
ncbi:MAG: OFA family MFS transporter [Tepidisphaeraceae bacterium]